MFYFSAAREGRQTTRVLRAGGDGRAHIPARDDTSGAPHTWHLDAHLSWPTSFAAGPPRAACVACSTRSSTSRSTTEGAGFLLPPAQAGDRPGSRVRAGRAGARPHLRPSRQRHAREQVHPTHRKKLDSSYRASGMASGCRTEGRGGARRDGSRFAGNADDLTRGRMPCEIFGDRHPSPSPKPRHLRCRHRSAPEPAVIYT
jgi:hypothetical protein